MSTPYEGDSTTIAVPGIKGTNTAAGPGVDGESKLGYGVHGVSHAGAAGVAGFNDGPQGAAGPGVYGESKLGQGVLGISHAAGPGVTGFNTGPEGAAGQGLYGDSQHWEGVRGIGHGKGAGVAGFNDAPDGVAQPGVWGESQHWEGVHGIGHGKGAGIAGFNDAPSAIAQPGVWGESQHGEGVHGVSHSPSAAAIAGIAPPGGLAGFFSGNVLVTGNHTVNGDIFLSGADCAEHFDITSREEVDAGTVMVINHEGVLEPSSRAYDRRVAGVISGAGAYRPGIVLDKQDSDGNRRPVALVGKVYCKVDAIYASIEVGDLLTTSPTLGHAMKAATLHAFGAVIGKALGPLTEGQGLIPILIALQ
jgi:hypothetical protein